MTLTLFGRDARTGLIVFFFDTGHIRADVAPAACCLHWRFGLDCLSNTFFLHKRGSDALLLHMTVPAHKGRRRPPPFHSSCREGALWLDRDWARSGRYTGRIAWRNIHIGATTRGRESPSRRRGWGASSQARNRLLRMMMTWSIHSVPSVPSAPRLHVFLTCHTSPARVRACHVTVTPAARYCRDARGRGEDVAFVERRRACASMTSPCAPPSPPFHSPFRRRGLKASRLHRRVASM